MSKEKQIIKKTCENCIHNELCEAMLTVHRIVKIPPRMCKFYENNAGYRKQSEGEWLKFGMWHECSVCHIRKIYSTDFAYCPNCGAHMKGGAE